MKSIVNLALAYMIVGVGSGLFYREFTKLNDWPAGKFTQLAVVHTHLLVLGFIMMLIVLLLDRALRLSGTKSFTWFLWLYNIGLVITSAMMVWHGSLTVLGQESTAMIAGLAGLGHIIITAGMVMFFVTLKRGVATQSQSVGNA